MKFQGAVIKEQGVTFAIVIVKRSVIVHQGRAKQMIASFQHIFPGIPIVLMAQDSRGRPTYYGRRDIARFLTNVPLAAIPWKEYSLN